MGAYHWREFIFPRVTRIYEAVRSNLPYVFIHSCGRTLPAFEMIRADGIEDNARINDRHRDRVRPRVPPVSESELEVLPFRYL